MSAYRRPPGRKFITVCDLARRRVVAVLACIDVLLPGIDTRRKKRIANKILVLCDGKDRRVRISRAQAQEIVLEHIQCIHKHCPMLNFAEPLSRELNYFFEVE